MLFTLPNSDTDGRVIISKINHYVNGHSEKAFAISSLGKKRYYSALKYATAVIGNSSSGLVEAPSFHIPTLNIGERQKGRARGTSIVDVSATYSQIKEGLKKVLSEDFREVAHNTINPYEKENTVENIFKIISTWPLTSLYQKHFYTRPVGLV